MLTDERYKQLMADVGMPNSRSLLQALKQAVLEATLKEKERCADKCSEYALSHSFDENDRDCFYELGQLIRNT